MFFNLAYMMFVMVIFTPLSFVIQPISFSTKARGLRSAVVCALFALLIRSMMYFWTLDDFKFFLVTAVNSIYREND